MNDEQESESYRLVAWILAIAVTIAIAAALIPGILLGLNSGGSTQAASPAAPAVTAASPAAAPAAAAPAVAAPAAAAATASTPSASAPAAPAAAANPAASGTSAAVAGPAKIYFDSGKVNVGADSAAVLKPVVDAIKSGAAGKAVVSGYHDKTGNPEQNAELAKNRAKAVRDELTKAGLTEAQVELQKPQETADSNNDREARRVEVTAVK